MKIEQIGDSCVRVWLSDDELGKWGICYDNLGEERRSTERLVRLVLAVTQRRDRLPERCLTVEAIPVDGGCVLLLSGGAARPATDEPLLYQLEDPDDLLDLAVRWERITADAAPCNALYERNGVYILVLYPVHGLSSQRRDLLAEYAASVGRGAVAAASVGEYGKCLGSGHALEQIAITMRGSVPPASEDRTH